MRYTVRKSVVHILGTIWMPAITASMIKECSEYDVNNMKDDAGKITRDSVEQWLTMNSGDFQRVTDFYASIEDGDETIEIPWSSEDNEMEFTDSQYPQED